MIKNHEITCYIPTYNEIENITRFIPSVMAQIKNCGGNILVVDDGSPDGTGKSVKTMQAAYSDSLFSLNEAARKVSQMHILQDSAGVKNAVTMYFFKWMRFFAQT
jgi:glycosyltransferase involved in cell wall biosynthesis